MPKILFSMVLFLEQRRRVACHFIKRGDTKGDAKTTHPKHTLHTLRGV
jgi:hypothetical protein